MGYLGREWDQSVFGSWARDIGGQTSSRRISGDPITTSTSAAWFTPNIRHRHDLWPAAQGARGKRRRKDHGIRRLKIENNDPTLSDRALDQRYWISDWPGTYFLFCMFQSESFHFDDFTGLRSCPVLWKYIPLFIFVSEFSLRVFVSWLSSRSQFSHDSPVSGAGNVL